MREVRGLFFVILVWLFVGLILGTGLAGSCSPTEGTIDLPWGPTTPTAFPGIDALHGVLVYKITGLDPGDSFSLRSAAPTQEICVNNLCGHVPDYNVAFFAPGDPMDARIATHDDPGPVEGVVPTDAEYALVWMRTGSHVPLVGGAVSMDDAFSWSMGC